MACRSCRRRRACLEDWIACTALKLNAWLWGCAAGMALVLLTAWR